MTLSANIIIEHVDGFRDERSRMTICASVWQSQSTATSWREGGEGRGGEGREGMGGRGGEGRAGEGRAGQGRAGQGSAGEGRGVRGGEGRGEEERGGEGRGLSTLSTNQNLCDRGA